MTEADEAADWACWPAPWAGVSAKLVHAMRHSDVLTSIAREFLEQPPIATEMLAAPERGPNWLKCDLHVTHPPDLIPLTLGDFLHNLRCALDHSLTAIDARAGRRLNFPVVDGETEFNKWAADWREAKGGEGPIAAIRARQAFNDDQGRNPLDYDLRIITRLNNADKHRLLTVTSVGTSDEHPPELTVLSNTPVISTEYVLPHGRSLQPRETALYIELDVPVTQPGVKINVEGAFPLGIAVIDEYFNVVTLSEGLHAAVVRTCRHLRQGTLDGWEKFIDGTEQAPSSV